jgi:hypothetical protein
MGKQRKKEHKLNNRITTMQTINQKIKEKKERVGIVGAILYILFLTFGGGILLIPAIRLFI